jgi:hypothetical protein
MGQVPDQGCVLRDGGADAPLAISCIVEWMHPGKEWMAKRRKKYARRQVGLLRRKSTTARRNANVSPATEMVFLARMATFSNN